jgi:hypothetical protein
MKLFRAVPKAGALPHPRIFHCFPGVQGAEIRSALGARRSFALLWDSFLTASRPVPARRLITLAHVIQSYPDRHGWAPMTTNFDPPHRGS